ncbi:MAG: T9SS type A sorting domain-containing protein [Bacteroidales bacterium]|nr:T9SS type A sorting domain-containing protein [Bacteroidales bacterium]MCF8345154.1 T9SS type A sorting domain-containing protein [Bacteroidales bacterium]MCF8352192.1 T9SS type A sorting domain-containing protein [Bacteroidales bacterium]MCF8375004.1 T9SS type A sorting domain-containing protein [Bacteroidales bacterium]MCF8402196.1 T9SS type A sorting domain-containing protein [Bacteroidales bacterium]
MKTSLATLTLLIISYLFLSIQSVEACQIGEVEAEVLPCNEAGQFSVLLDFSFEDVGAEGFRVQGSGNNYGSFEYDDLPLEIGPLDGDGNTVYEFVVIDNQIEDCSNWTAIDPVNCGGVGECEIWDVWAEPQPCNEEGSFYVLLDFEYNNVGEEGFHVQGNGTNYGDFYYENLPLEIGPLAGDGTTVYEFAVVDNQYVECSNWAEIDPVDCEGSGGDCEIDDLEVEVQECNDEGMFYALLDFEFENVSEEGFKLYINDDLFESYDYDDLPVEAGPLEGNGETEYTFSVTDQFFEGCNAAETIGPVDCEEGENSSDINENEILFPNPVIHGGTLNIQRGLEKPRDVLLYNSKGEVIFSEKGVQADKINISSKYLESGVYFYRIETTGRSYRGSLVVY